MKARLTLKVRAGARKTEFTGTFGDAWKLHVSAPPVDGKANQTIIRFLARLAGVPTAAVRIVSGYGSATKMVEIEGIESSDLRVLILRAILESHGHTSDTGSTSPSKP
jgi:uncharacterized protein (TIGR00251 family)